MAKQITFQVDRLRAVNAGKLMKGKVSPLTQVVADGRRCLCLFTTDEKAAAYLQLARVNGHLDAAVVGPLSKEDWLTLLAGMRQQGVGFVTIDPAGGLGPLDLVSTEEMENAIQKAA